MVAEEKDMQTDWICLRNSKKQVIISSKNNLQMKSFSLITINTVLLPARYLHQIRFCENRIQVAAWLPGYRRENTENIAVSFQ